MKQNATISSHNSAPSSPLPHIASQHTDGEDSVLTDQKTQYLTLRNSSQSVHLMLEQERMDSLPALAAHECSPPVNRVPVENRVATLSLVVKDDETGTSRRAQASKRGTSTAHAASVSLLKEQPIYYDGRIACIQPFVTLAFSNPPRQAHSSTAVLSSVKLHVYDLTKGLCGRHSEEIMGKKINGMFHSGIVCFGLEFYFEGGIGCASEGHTRFGAQYDVIHLGETTKTASEFIQWVHDNENVAYGLDKYKVLKHNCHHFSREAARFLLEESVPDVDSVFPSFVFSTSNDLASSELGSSLEEVLSLITSGGQHCIARRLLARLGEQQTSLSMMLNASSACGLFQIPPNVAFLFRVDNADVCGRTLESIKSYTRVLISKGVVKEVGLERVSAFCEQFATHNEGIDAQAIVAYVDVVSEALRHSPYALWGPILNGLRVAVLNKVVLSTCVFHKNLSQLLRFGCRDYPRLLPDGRLSLLRLLCNYGASAQGATALQCQSLCSEWVSVVGFGLNDVAHSAIAYTASCLAGNIALACIMISPSLNKEMTSVIDQHPLSRLATVILVTLRRCCKPEFILPEPTFCNLLLALCRIMATNQRALTYVAHHYLSPQYRQLLDRSETNESRALICLMKTLCDLYG